MSKPIKKILLFLLLIILLPILFLVGKELIATNEEEELLRNIYTSQLESILFSVNQYSDDVVRSWGSKIQSELDIAGGDYKKLAARLKTLFSESRSITGLVFTSDLKHITEIRSAGVTKWNTDETDAYIEANRSKLIRLANYKKAGYNKIETGECWSEGVKSICLLFVLENNLICGININPELFVGQNLAGKIQSISGNEFIVSVTDSASSRIIFSTSNQRDLRIAQRRALWLIPDYSMAISLKGRTIDDLVREKMFYNFVMISLLMLFMLVAAFWGYKNIKREIELAQIKSDFVSNVSHELRTPLALISMFAETLSMGRVKTDEKKQEYYDIIHQETDRLSKIVNKILSFSKIEAGKWKYTFVVQDLNKIVEDVFNTYKFHLKNSGFDFELGLSSTALIGSFDAETISEALINLIDNAVKYSAEKKYLMLRSGKNEKGIFVEVEDNGIGITTDEQKKIFDKFYRASTGEVHNTKGTGLGLTLVQHIAKAHKGSIELKSEFGKGSTFTLVFPEIQNV